MELSLNFGLKYDLELFDKGIILPISRLLSVIEFKSRDGWSRPNPVIIDTGSPVSVFPSSIQEQCHFQLIHQTRISGLVPDDKCSLAVKLVNLTFRLCDKAQFSRPIESKAYIASTEKIPLILGFADILEKFDLKISYARNKASLIVTD